VPGTIQAFFGPAQLQYLQSNGFEITVITSSKDALGRTFVLPKDVICEPVEMARTIKLWQDIKALFKIYSIIKKGKFDIVQYATPKASLFGSIAGWMARVPVRLYLMWGLYYVTQTGKTKLIFKTFEKIICALSTAIAPDSKGNYEIAVKEGLCKPEKISVVGEGSANGVDTERFNPEKLAEFRKKIRSELHITENALVFGCIAPMVKDKGINELIEAFSKVAEQNPHVFLLYIGRPTEKNPLEQSTIEIINNHKRISHFIFQAEPEKYLAAMDIFVLPTYREGFGVVNIEACAMELPVITTDVPGPQESIINGRTGLLVPPRAVPPLIEAMKRLVEDPKLRKQIGIAARQRIKSCYEQKQLWKAIVAHRRKLLVDSGYFREIDGTLQRI